MPRTQVPEEQQRVSDLSELKNKLAPTDERVVFVETAALSEPNFYWWDPSGEASNADGIRSVASNLSGFQDGDQDEGLWRRFDASFESATTDDLAEGSTNLYFSGERVDDRVSNLLVGGTDVTLSYNDGSNTLTVDSTDTDTQLTNEEVQDAVYNNVLSGTQTLVDVTYDDANNEVDYVVNDDLSLYDNSTSGFISSVPVDSVGDNELNTTNAPATNDFLSYNGSNIEWVDSANSFNNRVDVGFVVLSSTGTESVSGLTFEPNRIQFFATNPVSAPNEGDFQPSSNSNDDENTLAFMQGFAKNENGTTVQQASSTSGSGNSINAIRSTSTTNACIKMTLGGQNGSEVGAVTATLSSWNSDGFDLNVTEFSSIQRGAVLIKYVAFRSESLATTATNVSNNATQVATSVGDINFSSNLSVLDDGDGTVTINATDTNTQLSDEEVQDAVYNNVLSGTQTLITVTYDDPNNEVDFVVNDDLSLYDNSTSGFTTYDSSNFDTDFSSKSTDDLSEGTTNLYFSKERVDDRVANLIVGGTNITTTYDDVNNTLTIDGSGGSNLQNISTDTTTSGDRYYSVNSSSSEVTLTLSTADAKNGKEISVKRRGKKKVFINTEGSQTIDGSNKVRLNQDKNAVKLVFNSSNSEWEIY